MGFIFFYELEKGLQKIENRYSLFFIIFVIEIIRQKFWYIKFLQKNFIYNENISEISWKGNRFKYVNSFILLCK